MSKGLKSLRKSNKDKPPITTALIINAKDTFLEAISIIKIQKSLFNL